MLMRVFRRLGFRAKLGLGTTAIVVVMALLSAIPASHLVSKALIRENRLRGSSLSANLAVQAVDSMLARDYLRLTNLVDEPVAGDTGVLYSFLLDSQGNVLVHSFDGGFPTDLVAVNPAGDSGVSIRLLDDRGRLIDDFAAPVTVAGSRLGTVRIGISRDNVQASINELILAIIGLSALALVLAIGAATVFARRMTLRIKLLTKSAEDMVRGELDRVTAVPPKRGCREIMDCERPQCPAYGEDDLRCWYVAGTLCPDCEGLDASEKLNSCRICKVYHENAGDEVQELAETFDVMARSLKAHIRDLTEAHERLVEQQAQLIQSQKMEAVGKLAGGVAHEINTPLGVILGYAQLLQEDCEAESQMARDIAIIEKQANVCRKIVADLLGFSRIEESSRKEMSFNDSILEAAALVRSTLTMDQVRIQEDLDERNPVIVGDGDKLKQVWINFLNNARDAMEGGGAVHIRSRLLQEENTMRAWFADTGPGMSQEIMDRIFDPFFTTKPVGKGTGLGLSVSFGIIKDHGGTIRAESPVNEDLAQSLGMDGTRGPGTVFIVDLPVRPPDHDENEDMNETT
ncbi:MAG: PAS domain-containing sensor histidine kinase [Desulfovibrio sp.]|nr:MAG: PAS domain-containing sensor histidine kinase [Desulfovibrio sp.]